MLRIVLRGLGAVALVLVLIVAGALALREGLKLRNTEAYAIRAAGGIDEERFVSINGLDQWITIRGQDRRNPVLLILHGGPGDPQSFLIPQVRPLERDFVVVLWDQRGAGKTRAHAGGRIDPGLNVATMVADGLAVTRYVEGHLNRPKIVLVGISWGSFLGVRMAEAHPELYLAYVGTGQGAGTALQAQTLAYQRLTARMQAAGDAAGLAGLRAVGPPPWVDQATRAKAWRAGARYHPLELSFVSAAIEAQTAPHWSLADAISLGQDPAVNWRTPLRREAAADLTDAFGQSLTLPVIVIQGAEDLGTPAELAKAWVDRLPAKVKSFDAIPGGGHTVMLTQDDAFDRILTARLRPILQAGGA